MTNENCCCKYFIGLLKFWMPLLKVGIVIAIFSIAAIFIVSFLSHVAPNFFEIKTSSFGSEIVSDSFPVELNAAAAIFFALALVVVGWVQLQGLKSEEHSKFLLRISERYGSEPIIRARLIIHELYRASVKENPKFPEADHRTAIGEKIIGLSESNDSDSQLKYVSLLNMMDFLETIAYMANIDQDGLKSEALSELLGNSICFYYMIFEPKIIDKRKKYINKSFYTEFEKLYKRMKEDWDEGL